MAKEEAMQAGAMALFGEKYGDEVRVLRIGGFSTELCGGTHVDRAGDIGLFKIIGETGVAAGVRRIEAVTGNVALDWIDSRDKALAIIAGCLKSAPEKAADKVEQLLEKNKQLEKELERLKSKLASSAGGELSSQAVDIEGVKVLAVKIDDSDPKALRDMDLTNTSPPPTPPNRSYNAAKSAPPSASSFYQNQLPRSKRHSESGGLSDQWLSSSDGFQKIARQTSSRIHPFALAWFPAGYGSAGRRISDSYSLACRSL